MDKSDKTPRVISHDQRERVIRDVISIGKLVRKNDGTEEVEQILRTMTKHTNGTDAN
jgi:hypothetical protein